jgi:hypothetical protein
VLNACIYCIKYVASITFGRPDELKSRRDCFNKGVYNGFWFTGFNGPLNLANRQEQNLLPAMGILRLNF